MAGVNQGQTANAPRFDSQVEAKRRAAVEANHQYMKDQACEATSGLIREAQFGGTCETSKPEGEVTHRLELLRRGVYEASEILRLLKSRIQPILRPDGPQTKDESGAFPGSTTEIGGKLGDLIHIVESINVQLSVITESVEL